MVEKRFEKLGMPDIERFENYLPTAFNSELTLLQKVNKIIFDLIETNKLTNEMVDYLNKFIEKFDEKLYKTVGDVLNVWLEDGRLADIVRVAISEEVIEARTGYLGHTYLNLKERLDVENEEINTQLTQIAYNIKKLGAKGDGYLVDDKLTINGRIYSIQRYLGTDDSNVFNSNSSNKNIYVPDGVYIIDNNVTFTGNVTIRGQSKHGTIIVLKNGTIIDKCKKLRVENCSIVGDVFEFEPPVQLTESNYLSNENFGYKNNGITIYSNDGIKKDELSLDNVHFSMLINGVSTIYDSNNLSNNGYLGECNASNCSTNNIWWHGFGFRYTKKVRINKCHFVKHWVGLMCDFSMFTENAELSDCTGKKASGMFKCETGSNGFVTNTKVFNNVFTSFERGDFNFKTYCFKVMGKNHEISNNTITINESYPQIFHIYSSDTSFTNNIITVNGSNAQMFGLGTAVSQLPNIVIENNIFKGSATTMKHFLIFVDIMDMRGKKISLKNNSVNIPLQNFVYTVSTPITYLGILEIHNTSARCSTAFINLSTGTSVENLDIIGCKVNSYFLLYATDLSVTSYITKLMINNNVLKPLTVGDNTTLIFIGQNFNIEDFVVNNNIISGNSAVFFRSTSTGNEIKKLYFTNNIAIMSGSLTSNPRSTFRRVRRGAYVNNTIDCLELINSTTHVPVTMVLEKFNDFEIVDTKNTFIGESLISAYGAD